MWCHFRRVAPSSRDGFARGGEGVFFGVALFANGRMPLLVFKGNGVSGIGYVAYGFAWLSVRSIHTVFVWV